ncbi:hypothetical protein FACS1894120_5320 [Clostridia bacterium]|nr:hypothetical protein FACS1894120_5320 [Clostridia bacterium]
MTPNKIISGKDGVLHLYSKKIHFADAERFTLQLIETTNGDVSTGQKLYMVVQDITVRDEISTSELINEMLSGGISDIAFQGKYRTHDGFAERVIFRNCVTCGSFDVMQLANGYLDAWAFWVNASDKEFEQLDKA